MIMNKYFHEIKYFHPEGKDMPNSVYIHKGFFLNECERNADNFVLSEGVCADQYGLSKYKGGVIIFSTDVNAVQSNENRLTNKIRQLINTYKNRLRRGKIISDALTTFNASSSDEQVTSYTVGHSFKGSYLSRDGKRYDENSVSIEINGLSTESLLKLAEIICKYFRQECVLVKDLNKNKIYLAEAIPSSSEDIEKINKVNIDCV